MSFTKKMLVGLFSVLFSTTSLAQNFYVCDSNGNDEYDGRSEAKPFKTYAKAIWRFNDLKGGESLLFCRGGKFEANTVARLYNKNCSASNRCTIGDYGDENLPRPVISANGVHAINFENGGGAREDGGYVVKNLTLIAATKSGAGVQLYNDVDDVLITNMHIEGFNIGVYSAASNPVADGAISNQINDRLVVKDSTIINNKKIGFLGACNDCLIENNHFESNGNHKSLDHNIYLAQKVFPARGITIRNNFLYRSAIVDGKCQGVSLVGHGLLEDVLIENNIIKEDLGKVTGGCWGISIDPGYATIDEAFRNITIRKNKVINVGGVAIGCASCEGVLIENNEIIDEGNVLRAGVSVPVREENTLKSKDVKIRGNKIIVIRDDANGVHIGGSHKSTVYGNEITLPSNTRMDCFRKENANLTTDTTNNLCKNHNGLTIIDKETSIIPPQNDEQVAETPINNESSDETDTVIVDNSNDEELNNNQEQVIVDNQLVNEYPGPISTDIADSSSSQDNFDQELVVNDPLDSNTNPNSTPTENVELPSSDLVTINNNLEQAPIVSNLTIDQLEVAPISDGGSSTPNSKPRNTANSGSSSSNSSKPKKTSTDSTNVTSEDVATYTTVAVTNEANTNIMSLETEPMEVTKGVPKTDSESNKHSVKVKDVIEASRNQNEITDVTQCRAYAAGKCLMK